MATRITSQDHDNTKTRASVKAVQRPQQESKARDSQSPIASAGSSQISNTTSTPASTTTTTTVSITASSGNQESIKVAVRLRPFTEKEKQRNCKRCVDIEQNTVALYNPKYEDNIKKFTFDHSYWSHDGFKRSADGFNVPDPEHPNSAKYVSQERVFEDLGEFLLENALQGYNSALLAYGQTGSGKSYTVSGYGKNEGILPRFARELFNQLDERLCADTSSLSPPAITTIATDHAPASITDELSTSTSTSAAKSEPRPEMKPERESEPEPAKANRYEVYFSMIEIYNEVVRDLLAKNNGYIGSQASSSSLIARRGLRVREHPKRGFFVENLASFPCANKEEIERLIEEGQLNKSIVATSMNETSSRGHTIYEFHIKQYKLKTPCEGTGNETAATATATNQTGSEHKPNSTTGATRASGTKGRTVETLTTSVVQLVDLAGSERMAVHVTGGGGASSMVIGETVTASSRSSSPFRVRDESGAGAAGAASSSLGKGPGASGASKRSSSTGKRAPANSAASSSSVSSSNNQQSASGYTSTLRAPAAVGGLAPTSASSFMHHQAAGSGHAILNNRQQRFKESVSINQSLSVLGNCIQVLSQYSQQQLVADSGGAKASGASGAQQQQPKIPYRDSVLTKLLNRCCLSGNSKVVLIATLSPADANYDDTLSTLRFADRAKQIRTHATINRMSRGEMVSALQRENERLKQILDGRVTRSDDSSQTSNFDDTENMLDNFAGPKAAGSSSGAGGAGATPHPASSKVSQSTGRPDMEPRVKNRAAGQQQQQSVQARGRTSVRQNKFGQEQASVSGPAKKGDTTATSGATETSTSSMKDRRGAPSRSRTRLGAAAAPGGSQASQIDSNQMKQLVSPGASKTIDSKLTSQGDDDRAAMSKQQRMKKSRSLGHGLGGAAGSGEGKNKSFDVVDEEEEEEEEELDFVSGLLDDIELNDELANIDDENLLSPDSDDSPPADDNLTNEEKIDILNKLLSNTNVANKMATVNNRGARGARERGGRPLIGRRGGGGKLLRPKKASGTRQKLAPPNSQIGHSQQQQQHDLNRVSAISSSLKRTNPYLSNLNADEQLTGMITYIIKPGEMIVGKNSAVCDLLIYGPELRARHAKLTRIDQDPNETGTGAQASQNSSATNLSPEPLNQVFIEPILDHQARASGDDQENHKEQANAKKRSSVKQSQKVALFINGEPVLAKTKLNHCDRVLFGSNAYFVFIDNRSKNVPGAAAAAGGSGDTASAVVDAESVTYDMAHNEVLRKIMSDAKNEAMIREINDYTHRPGTGKHSRARAESTSGPVVGNDGAARPSSASKQSHPIGSSIGRLGRSITIHGDEGQTNSGTTMMKTDGESSAASLASSTSGPPLVDASAISTTAGGASRIGGSEHDSQQAQTSQLAKIKEEEEEESIAASARHRASGSADAEADTVDSAGQPDPVDESYREKLMEDTYEFAMPVAEANAMAKEMGIKVTYGFKIMTGEEQLLQHSQAIVSSSSADELTNSYENDYNTNTGGAAAATDADELAYGSEEVPRSRLNSKPNNYDNSIATVPRGDERQFAAPSSGARSFGHTVKFVLTRSEIKPDSLDVPPELYIHVHLDELDLDFYWSKEKFQERRFKMLELYGAWDVGGKPGLVEYLIEQSRYQGYYMIDPFIDDIQTSYVLIGHAQVSLQPITHLSDLSESFDILDVNDDIVGSIQIEAIPCHPDQLYSPLTADGGRGGRSGVVQQGQRQGDGNSGNSASGGGGWPFKVMSADELATSVMANDNDTSLLNSKFVFLLKIVSCSNIPDKYAQIFCQYTFDRDNSIVRTSVQQPPEPKREFGDTGNATESYPNTDEPNKISGGGAAASGSGQSIANQDEQPTDTNSNGAMVLEFNHLHFVVIDHMNQDVLDFLRHGFLTIQVVGQYKLAPPTRSAASATNSDSQQSQLQLVAESTSSRRSSSTIRQLQSVQPTLISTIINSINKYRFRMEQQAASADSSNSANSYSNNNIYAKSLTDSARSNRVASSNMMNSQSGPSSIASASATINLFDQQNEEEEGMNSINDTSQENIIDMILTKRKLDRAENQLHYLKRTINIAEHYNRKHIPIKTVKKLLSSYGRELEGGSLEEMAADVPVEKKAASSKQSGCSIH